DIARSHVATVHLGGTARRRVLGALLGLEDRGKSAGDDPLHLVGVAAEGRRTLARVEDAEPPRGSGADVEQPAAAAKGLLGDLDHTGDGFALRRDSVGDRAILGVYQVDDLEGRCEIDRRRARVPVLRDSWIEQTPG